MGFAFLLVAAVFVAPSVGVMNLLGTAVLLLLNRKWKKRWIKRAAVVTGALGGINLCICTWMFLKITFGGA